MGNGLRERNHSENTFQFNSLIHAADSYIIRTKQREREQMVQNTLFWSVIVWKTKEKPLSIAYLYLTYKAVQSAATVCLLKDTHP